MISTIHLSGDSAHLFQTFHCQMASRLHQEEHVTELLEVHALLRLQRMFDEEWNDELNEVFLAPHPIGPTIAVVCSNDATAKEGLESVQELDIALVLNDGELRKYLIAYIQVRMTVYSDMKAAFTVDEAGDPLGIKVHLEIPNVKSLRVPCESRAFPADCPHVRLIFTARYNANEYRTAVGGVSRI